jgi:chromosome partitioning protein
MKTIAILSQKGGSGKTTLAIHLAVAACEAGYAAMVADLDPQASASMWHKARAHPLPHVQPTHPAALAALLGEAARQGIELFLVDTAPQSDNPAIAAAEAADLVLITCRPSVMDLRAIQNTIRLARLAEVTPYVVLTQVDPFGTLHEEAVRTLEGLGVEVLPGVMGRRVAYHHGLIDGRTALEYESAGKAATEVRSLFHEISRLAGLSSSQRGKPHVETSAA